MPHHFLHNSGSPHHAFSICLVYIYKAKKLSVCLFVCFMTPLTQQPKHLSIWHLKLSAYHLATPSLFLQIAMASFRSL